MAVPPGSHAEIPQSPEALKRLLNEYREMFLRDGGVLREEDGLVFSGAVHTFVYRSAFQLLLRSAFTHGDAEELAAEIACNIWSLALSEKHFRRWVLTDNSALASTYLGRCVRNRAYSAMKKAKRFRVRNGVHVSLDDPTLVRHGSEDGEDAGPIQLTDSTGTIEQEIVAAETFRAYRAEFTELDKRILDGSLKLKDVVALEGGSLAKACRHGKRCRAKLKKLLGH